MREEAEALGGLDQAAEKHRPGSDSVIVTGFPMLGVWRRSSRLCVTHGWLSVHYGIWSFETPLANVAHVDTSDGCVRITFHRPVHGHEPVGIRHRDLTLAVDDPDAVARALRARLDAPGAGDRSVQDGPRGPGSP